MINPPYNYIPVGWVCPKCSRVNAPSLTTCVCANLNYSYINTPTPVQQVKISSLDFTESFKNEEEFITYLEEVIESKFGLKRLSGKNLVTDYKSSIKQHDSNNYNPSQDVKPLIKQNINDCNPFKNT